MEYEYKIMEYKYKGKRIFKVLLEEIYWEMKVEIDFDCPDIMRLIEGMVEFWTDWEYKLECNDGDYVVTFLQILGQKVFFMINDCGGLYRLNGGEEGYCKMDGSRGIKIIDVDPWEINFNELKVSMEE